MIRFTQKQIDAIAVSAQPDDERTDKEVAKDLGLSVSAVGKWRRRLRGEKGRRPKKSGNDKTRKMLTRIAILRLEEDPDLLSKVLKMIDWESLL